MREDIESTTADGFLPGFRLSVMDVIILVVGAAAGAVMWWIDFWGAIGTWYVVAHFFVFCNVLRMARPLELIWAGTFVCLGVAVVLLELISWPVVIGVSAAMTGVLAVIEIRKPSYHGVGWRKLNPGLLEWWQANGQSANR